jgi:flagellar protein FliO/FliZ
MLQNALPAFGLLVLMVLVAWLLKRSRHQIAGLAGHAGPSLRVMNSLALGPQQRVVTVQVGQGAEGVCLVLGVTAGSITALHQLPCPVAPDASAPTHSAAPGFAGLLAQIRHPHAPR